ncbi:MAG: metal-dependent hydrolase [Myxococcota bacterium]
MADLVTHAAVAVLVKAATGRPHVAVFVAGNLLPDLLSRLPSIMLNMVGAPRAMVYAWEPMHTPFGMVVAAYFLSLWFPADQRRMIFLNLLGGMFLHLGLDMLQTHLQKGYTLLFPFSMRGFELAVIGSEATVPWAIPLAILAAIAWRWRTRQPTASTDGVP